MVPSYFLPVLVAAFTRGGLSRHHKWISIDGISWVVSTRGSIVQGVVSTRARIDSAGASAFYTLPFSLNPGDATRTG